MRQKKENIVRNSFTVSFVRVLNVLLILYAAGIIGITYASSEFAANRYFAVMVASPMLLTSFFNWFAATTNTLFGTAIFFSVFLALALTALPMMMRVFFPVYCMLFVLAAFYGISAILLARCCFLQPILKKK